MKKALPILISFMICWCMLPAFAQNISVKDDQYIENEITYVLSRQEVWVVGCSSIKRNVKVLEEIDSYPVTGIASGALEGLSGEQAIFLPPSIVNIEASAFSNEDAPVISAYLGSYAIQFASKNGLRYHVLLPLDMYTCEPADYEVEFQDQKTRIVKYYGSDSCIQIPDIIDGQPVTEIGASAFAGLGNVKRVILPDGVKSIGTSAFKDCENLNEVHLPDGLLSIGENAFENTPSLNMLEIPATVASIGNQALAGCAWLINNTEDLLIVGNGWLIKYLVNQTHVTLPKEVQVIASVGGQRVFIQNKASLSSITLHEGLKEVGLGAFMECDELTAIQVPIGVRTIGSGAFYNCKSLKSIALPETVNLIGNSAFYQCAQLESIQLPQALENIQEEAFSGCDKLPSIKLPNNLKQLSRSTFDGYKGEICVTKGSGTYDMLETYEQVYGKNLFGVSFTWVDE